MERAMVFTTMRGRWTDKELMALPSDGRKYELIGGDLIMSPVAATHGIVCLKIGSLLLQHVQSHRLGEVFDSSTGFRLAPSIMLSPDVAFASTARLKTIFVSPDKFLAGAPELVVEVISPSDRPTLIEAKVVKYFAHGTELVWLVNMKKQEVMIRTAASERKLIGLNAVLTGGDVLPKFKCRLGDIFGRA